LNKETTCVCGHGKSEKHSFQPDQPISQTCSSGGFPKAPQPTAEKMQASQPTSHHEAVPESANIQQRTSKMQFLGDQHHTFMVCLKILQKITSRFEVQLVAATVTSKFEPAFLRIRSSAVPM
jgi:hypothetical protein